MLQLKLLVVLTFCGTTFAQVDQKKSPCTHCKSIADALEDPKGVTHLDLSALGLGELPKEINQFTALESLDLSENFIQEINFDTLLLVSLKELNLSRNPGFNTLDLDGIANCSPNLEKIDLSNTNCLSVSTELLKCKQLASLDLSSNWIQYLPSKFGDFNNLNYLNLSNNKFKMMPFLEDVWGLNTLDISENSNLRLADVASALLLKESLKTLILSTDKVLDGAIPDAFEVLQVDELVLKNCSINRLNNRLSRNRAIKTIVLDNVNVINSKRFVSWLNRLEHVNKVEYRNMQVHPNLEDVVSVDYMQFDNCTFHDINELRKVKPHIDMIAKGTDLRNGEFIGNAKVVDYEKSEISVSSDVVAMNDDMLENTLEPIVDQQEKVKVIPADTPCEIKTENALFEVPADAFLTSSGKVYDGDVKVVVKEYMDPIENALTSAPMVNRVGDRNEIFSSSGMLDFRAYDDQGNELQPNPDNIIQVQMNDLQPSENPNFYSFDEEENNWSEELPPASSNFGERKSEILDSLNKLSAAQVTGYRAIPVFIGLNYKKSRKDPYELSFWTDRGRKIPLLRIKNFQQEIFTSNSDQQWIANRNTWKIDTILTDDTKQLLVQIKKDVKRARKRFGDSPKKINFKGPRVIKDLALTPNLENDNYTLSFRYRDTIRSIPVIPSFEGSIRRIQAKEKSNFKSFQIAQKTALKEKALIANYENTVLEEYAKVYRARQAQLRSGFPDYNAVNREYLRFGLTKFGLVNCDYFYRNVPDTYIVLDTTGVDGDGRYVRIPSEVRNVYLRDNVFVATNSNNVPVYNNKRSLIFFLITSTEIAVIKGWQKLKNGLMRPNVERVPIRETDTPDVIRKKLLSARK